MTRALENQTIFPKNNNKGETEIKQTSKDMNHARKAYFELIQTPSMARTKHTTKREWSEMTKDPQRLSSQS